MLGRNANGSFRPIPAISRMAAFDPLPTLEAFAYSRYCKGGDEVNYFRKGIAKTQVKRDQKAMLLASIRAGTTEPLHGLTKDEAITILLQDIADYDQIIVGLGRPENV